jgi:hypothetical protein
VGSVAEGPDRVAERRIAQIAGTHGGRLDLSGLGLTAVPGSIGQLTALTWLDLEEVAGKRCAGLGAEEAGPGGGGAAGRWAGAGLAEDLPRRWRRRS